MSSMQRLSLLLHVAIPRNGNDDISTTPSLTQSATSNQFNSGCTGTTPLTVPNTPQNDYATLEVDSHSKSKPNSMKCMSVSTSFDSGDSPDISPSTYSDDDDDEAMDIVDESYSHSPLDDTDDDSDDDLPMDMLSLMRALNESDDDLLFARNGYKKLSKICDSLQGQMFRARLVEQTSTNNLFPVGSNVAIKKIDKALRKDKVAEKDDMTYCVEEDIKKEAAILQHLTVDNTPTGKDIARFIEFFESESHLYLVTEYIDGLTLKEFYVRAHSLVAEGKLTFMSLSVCVKSIMFQLVQTIKWLHGVYHCCHLDVCADNVMVHNVHFDVLSSGKVELRGTPKVKLIDFGVAEIFDTPRNRPTKAYSFECSKSEGLNIDESARHAPESSKGTVYDARAMDMWSLGMILFECLVGRALYEPEDMWQGDFDGDDEEEEMNGYTALKANALGLYLKSHGVLKCFTRESFSLLSGLLCMDPSQRLKAVQAGKQPWFKSHFKRNFYAKKLKKKQNRWRSVEQQHRFPYYQIEV